MTTIPKKHHYVPVAYLKNFSIANDPSRIQVYDKSTDKIFPSRVQDAACETNFNTVEISGQKINLEKLFDRIDNNTPPLIRKILAGERIDHLNQEERYGILAATAVQVLRAKIARTSLIDFMRQLGQSVQNSGINPEDIENFRIPDEGEAKLLAFQNLPLAGDLTRELAKKICVLHKTSDKPFWVSDNPVVTFNSFPYGQTGFAAQGVEIYLPLSKSLLLAFYCPTIGRKLRQVLAGGSVIGNPEWHQQLFEGMLSGRAIDSSSHVEFFNSLQVSESHRFVFSPTNDFSLAQELVSRHPELSRVEGRMRAGRLGTVPRNDRMPTGTFLVLTGHADHVMLLVQSWVDEPEGGEFEVRVDKELISEGLKAETAFVAASLFEAGYEMRMVRGVRLKFRDAGQFYDIQVQSSDEGMNQITALMRETR
jgi:hypothetical protein